MDLLPKEEEKLYELDLSLRKLKSESKTQGSVMSEEEGNGIDIGEEFQTLTELMGRCNVAVQTFQFRLNLQHLKPCE